MSTRPARSLRSRLRPASPRLTDRRCLLLVFRLERGFSRRNCWRPTQQSDADSRRHIGRPWGRTPTSIPKPETGRTTLRGRIRPQNRLRPIRYHQTPHRTRTSDPTVDPNVRSEPPAPRTWASLRPRRPPERRRPRHRNRPGRRAPIPTFGHALGFFDGQHRRPVTGPATFLQSLGNSRGGSMSTAAGSFDVGAATTCRPTKVAPRLQAHGHEIGGKTRSPACVCPNLDSVEQRAPDLRRPDRSAVGGA